MNKHIFCSRKGGAMIKGKFYAHPRTSEILARQLEKATAKQEKRNPVKPVSEYPF